MQTPIEKVDKLLPDMRRLSYHLASLIDVNGAEYSKEKNWENLLFFAIRLLNAAGGITAYTKEEEIVIVNEQFSAQSLNWSKNLRKECLSAAEKALTQQRLYNSPLKWPSSNETTSHPAVWLIAAPFPLSSPAEEQLLSNKEENGKTIKANSINGVLVLIIMTGKTLPDEFLLTSQLLATLFPTSLYSAKNSSLPILLNQSYSKYISQNANQDKTERSRTSRLFNLNNDLKIWAQADQSILALINRRGVMELTAHSELVNFNPRTEQARILDKTVKECLFHRHIQIFQEHSIAPHSTSITDKQNRDNHTGSLLLQDFAKKTNSCGVIRIPLITLYGKGIGALLLCYEKKDEPPPVDRLHSTMVQLKENASLLTAVISENAQNKTFQQNNRSTNKKLRNNILIAILFFSILFLLPLPYSISCKSSIHPASIRYITTRFDGILDRVAVKPGDQVAKGDLLATLDGREIAIELAHTETKKNKAEKIAKQYLARGNTAGRQLAQLDRQRYVEQLKLLREREKNRNIMSPVSGIVLTGDLERLEQSPVNKGETLFEIAPLETMRIELAIAEEDISFVQPGAEVTLFFTAYAGEKWHAKIDHIIPQSEIIENRNVFIGEISLANKGIKLRPGMQGKAKIRCGNRSLAWQYFRKPWFTLLRVVEQLL